MIFLLNVVVIIFILVLLERDLTKITILTLRKGKISIYKAGMLGKVLIVSFPSVLIHEFDFFF